MTAIEILMRRSDISEEDAAYYVDMAESRVCLFLKIDKSSADISAYLFSIADIATLMYQMDASIKNTKSTLGYSSRSFSEGGVSTSGSGMTGADIRVTYESEINQILNNLDNNAGKVRFL